MKLYFCLVVALAMAGVGCSDDTGIKNSDITDDADVVAVEATMQAARGALAGGDVAAFMDVWTDDGLQDVFHEFGGAFVANTGYYLGAKQYSLGESAEPTVAGDTATTIAPLFFRLVGVFRQFSLIKIDGVWRIDGATLSTADAGDVAVIDVEFGESSIDFDPLAIVDGDIALQVHNSTNTMHEFNIVTAPPEQDLAAFFEHPEDGPPVPEGKSMPEGFDFVGGVNEIESGASVTIVFAQTLPAARYFVFCNTEDDASREAHSKRGEFAEFTID